MTIRHDLLRLEDEDLAAISNRGNVNRAHREMAKGTLTFQIQESAGDVEVTWSDGVTCTFAADKTVAESLCTCPATTVCRHLLRSVFAYQETHRDVADERPIPSAWNPGAVDDTSLNAVFQASTLRRARQVFEAGVVAEAVISIRPSVRFFRLGHTVRFMVEHDARYTQCDCSETSPCLHAAAAILAFRALDGASGRVDTTPKIAFDQTLLDSVETSVLDLCSEGFANTTSSRIDRLAGLEKSLWSAGMSWPGSILQELRQQHEHYRNHDARFSPDVLSDLIGELLIRLDALRNPDLPLPQLFVAGSSDEYETKLGQSRLVGLGCVAHRRHQSVEVSAILQDAGTGKIMALSRTFPDANDGTPATDYAVLGNRLAVKGRSLSAIGRGQLVVKSAKLTSGHHIEIGRSSASVYAQKYTWEDLRPPAHVVEFREISDRLLSLPPASLRPRRVGEDFFVIPVIEAREVRFDDRIQSLRCELVDGVGRTAQLRHDYETRNRAGTERLLNWLTERPHELRYVAGQAHKSVSGLEIRPSALIFETQEGRVMIQPWVDDMDDHLEVAEQRVASPSTGDSAQTGEGLSLERFRSQVADTLGSMMLAGISAPSAAEAGVAQLAQTAESLEMFGLCQFLRKFDEASDAASRRNAFSTAVVWSRLFSEMN